MSVWDLSQPEEPRQIGFMPVDGVGLHRIWYVGGRWAYASALIDGFSDYIMITIDVERPDQAARGGAVLAARHESSRRAKRPTGRSNTAATGSITPSFMATPPIAAGGTAVWRLSMSPTEAKPKLIKHKMWAPPFGGGTHNALPLPDRDLLVVVDEVGPRPSGRRRQADLDFRYPRAEQSGQHLDVPVA